MRTLFFSFTVGLLCLHSVAAQSGGSSKDEAAVRDMVKRYADARDLKDPKSIAALFTSHADQLVSTGEWRRGTDELVKGMLASSARETGKRVLEVDTVRFVAPGVAIADAKYEIGESNGERRRMWSTFVIRQTPEGWRIEAIRNMLPGKMR